MYEGSSNSPNLPTILAGNSACDDHYQAVPGDLATSQTGEECKDLSADTKILNPKTDNAEAPIVNAESTPSGAEPSNLQSEPDIKGCSVGENPISLPLSSDVPLPPQKRYAHHGKRRRRFTEELFRCPYVDKVSRSEIVCNALLWRNRFKELRQHLLEHLTVDQIGKMTDDEVRQWYTAAKRIFLAGIPEDEMDNEEDEPEED